MFRLLRRIIRDILSGRNIETYAITATALVIAVLSVVEDVVPIDLQMAAILAALALLVFKSTAPEANMVDLDQVLRDRQSFDPVREFIKGGSEVWIYGPSAVNILSNSSDLEREVLIRGGQIRVLLQDLEAPASLELLHQQLDAMNHLLEDDIRRSVSVLETLRSRNPRISYRFAPYSPGFSLVIVDPDGRDGRLIVEFFGYASETISDRMHIEIHRQQSNYWFEYWAKQFEVMWKAAKEPSRT